MTSYPPSGAGCRPRCTDGVDPPHATLEFWFDFASTYSYLTVPRIEALAEAARVRLGWRAFLLGPIFREQGWRDSPFNLYPAKGRYMWRDLERSCARLELPYRRPSVFPRNGLLAARVACHHSDATWLPSFVRAVFRANFAKDLDIADPKVIGECLDEVGEDGKAVIEAAQSPESKQQLITRTDAAAQLGIFGAPTFVVAGELYWGSDRLAEALTAARSSLPAGAHE